MEKNLSKNNLAESKAGKKLLMISTDRNIFKEGSAVYKRQIEYARDWDEVHIIIFQKRSMENKKREESIASNCFIYSTHSFSKINYPFDAIKLGKFIIERRGITNITCQDPFLTAMAGASLKSQFKNQRDIKLEIQLHTDIGSPYYTKSFINRVRKTMALSYLKKADSIRVVSTKIKNYLALVLGIGKTAADLKIAVKPIYVNVDRIKSMPVDRVHDLRSKYSQFKKIVLMASRLEKEKNIEMALQAWPTVLNQIPDAGLIIVGRGSEAERLKSVVDESRISTSVVFEPWVDADALVSYYKTSDLFLLTSFFEGYGMTLVEAQAAGLKIVSTDVGVASDVGATIVGYNSRDLAEAIINDLKK